MKISRRAPSADFSSGHRSAIIDIGSNTVRLVIYGGSRRAPLILHNEKVAAGLGQELAETGAMSEEAMETALAGLARYAMLLEDLRIEDVEVVATAAPREASNGPQFLARVRDIGLEPRLLTGPEEARIGASGVLGAFPRARGVVADLGGGSLELTAISPDGPQDGMSLPLGSLRLVQLRKGRGANFRARVEKMLQKSGWMGPIEQPLYMVGGTWRSLATYALSNAGLSLDDPHGFAIDHGQAQEVVKRLRGETPANLEAIPGISAMRAAVLPDAAALLKILLDGLKPSGLVFSSWGLREGLLCERLDASARSQDPLLAGVAAFATPRGGSAAAATRLAAWTVEALPAAGRGGERLRLAATMLALASIQIEPNLRLRQSIDWALHKRWIDLDAAGRACIAATLSANCGVGALPPELRRLADKAALQEAVSWGFAIRLCRRLGLNSRNSLEASALRIVDGTLILVMEERRAALCNRGVEKDLVRLADSLGLASSIEVVPDGSLLVRDERRQA
jgi:exopolyphosphatase/guanosine-5'-triphosphate,3'-diphosphate pyrophosphatase